MENLIDLVRIAATVLTVLIFVRVILSWINTGGTNHPLLVLVYRITEPMLGPVRSLLPALGGVDFSPVVVLFGIQIAERLLIQLLVNMAN